MLMNCKRKIHEKLVLENAPQNPEAIKGIRAYLLAPLSYATMSKRCENADFDLHIDIEGDETLFETEDESAGEIIRSSVITADLQLTSPARKICEYRQLFR